MDTYQSGLYLAKLSISLDTLCLWRCEFVENDESNRLEFRAPKFQLDLVVHRISPIRILYAQSRTSREFQLISDRAHPLGNRTFPKDYFK